MPAKEWLTPRDLEWLKVSERKLGGSHFGEVYFGRLKFKGGKPFSVAVKQFLPNRREFDWRKYEKAIASLRQAGVRTPKMALLEHGGRKVLVSELFASRGKSKILEFRQSIPGAVRDAVLDAVAKIINAGYEPAPDAIGVIKTRKGFEPIVHDLDYLALEEKHMVAPSAQDWLRRMYPTDKAGRVKALETLLTKVTHPLLRSELQKLRGKTGFFQ